MTEAGVRMMAALGGEHACDGLGVPVRDGIAAIEAEAIAAEWAHWHRMPGTYRSEDATEVVVDLPESLSWMKDEFPDEIAAILAALPPCGHEAEIARLREAIWAFLAVDYRAPAKNRAILHAALAEVKR